VINGHWPEKADTIPGYQDPFPRTAPVGSFPANRHGLHDLGGNAWEWCEDEIRPGAGSHVLRGASWDMRDRLGLLASRRIYDLRPGSRYDFTGFRCVAAPSGAAR
jgi:formylglycine-generating enzyme required for sulfatase activity